jgi:hypothetical protein
MKIITIDAEEWDVKYMQSKESITVDFGTASFEYPDFVGSKMAHNSTSSDIYSLTFAIHKTIQQKFLRSIKKLYDPNNIIVHDVYKNMERIILEHPDWGAIKGNIIGSLKINSASSADIVCSCVFKEHTEDEPIEKKDLESENAIAYDAIDTSTGFDVTLSTQDKSALGKLADGLGTLYNKIVDSAVVSAFNDLNSALNAATIDSMRIMNAFKNVLSLPNQISPDLDSKITLLTGQATAIKDTPVSSYNIALFNASTLSYNMGATSQTPFVSEAALEAAAGIKSVPLT